jgi:AGZA family xanthine/uracil permease-like MFS transporter
VQLGNLGNPGVWLALAGLLTITCLLALKVRGALLIGILAVTIVAALSGAPVYFGRPFSMPEGGLIQTPAWPVDLFLRADLAGAFGLGVIGVVFIFLFVDLLDTAGTLVGLSLKSGFASRDGLLPRASQAFAADAVATTIGALVGTSTTTTYIESAAGIEDGGRTGLTALVVALLFGLSIFASPLAAIIPGVATAPVLIVIGAMMMGTVARIQWDDLRESVPAFLTIVAMPLTYSIANGIAFGIVSYAIINAATGTWRKVHWLMAVLAVVLVVRYVYMAGS